MEQKYRDVGVWDEVRDRFPIAKEDWLQPPGESKLRVKGKLQECLDPSVMCGMGVGGFALCTWHGASRWLWGRMTDPTMCLSSTNTFHLGWSEKNRLNCSVGGGGSVSRKGREVQTHPTHLVAAVESGKIFRCGRLHHSLVRWLWAKDSILLSL